MTGSGRGGDWDEPTSKVHRAINAGRRRYEEIKAAFDWYVAYFGPYEVNEAERVVIHHVKGSIFPNEVGRDNIRYYEFSGDRLTLILTNRVDGKLTPKSSSAARVIWERVKL